MSASRMLACVHGTSPRYQPRSDTKERSDFSITQRSAAQLLPDWPDYCVPEGSSIQPFLHTGREVSPAKSELLWMMVVLYEN